MEKKIAIVLLFFANVHHVFSQSVDYRTPVIPPSPTSSVFSKYGDDQPSLTSGTVNIPISLFDIQTAAYTIPLSLKYQTSGINIMDAPYPAGYGWVFSSGFRITRTVLGRPDDRFNFRQSNASEDYETLKPGIISEFDAGSHGLNFGDLFDTQKDIFSLHLPSGTFQFFINKVGSNYEVVSIGHDLKIEVLSGTAGWKVTDDKGVVYSFGCDENGTSCLNHTEVVGNTGIITAWVLREITLPNAAKISFSWINVNINNYAVETATPISVYDYKNYNCENTGYEVHDVGGLTRHSSYVNVLILSKIEYPNGVVDLSYKSVQEPFLQSLVVKNKGSESIKTVNFTYGSGQDQFLLQSLAVNGDVYHFQYNQNRFTKNSTSLDYWGYYNGKSNYNLLPNMNLKIYSGPTLTNNSLAPNASIQVGTADRSVSEEHMKAYMLSRITYPTGGYSEYEYEAHRFPGHMVQSSGLFVNPPAPISMGGGLRVSQIRTYADASAAPLTKVYKYGPQENGMANNSIVPTLDTFIDEYWQINEVVYPSCQVGFDFATHRTMNINALSNYSKFLINKNSIWYDKVTEYSNDHKTEYLFSHNDDGVTWEANHKAVKSPYVFSYQNFFDGGPNLTSTTLYVKQADQSYVPVKRTVNEYETLSDYSGNVSSVIIDRNAIVNYSSLPGPDLYASTANFSYLYFDASEVRYHAIPYSVIVQSDRLKKVTTTDFFDGNSLANYTDYTYSGARISKKVTGTSVADQAVTTEYKYPDHFSDPIYQEMSNRNMVGHVIEEITSRNTSVISRVKTNYSNSPGLILPVSVQTAFSGGGTLTTEVTYESYDAKGNILQLSRPGGGKVAYLWAYNGQYPIAEIKNATYDEVRAVLGGETVVGQLNALYPTDGFIREKMAVIRGSLPAARVTSFTYKPLVGMTSSTDVKGQTTYYEYDNLQRLKYIKDHNGKIVKSFDYHFKQ